MEKATIRDGGFVVESGVVGVELPLQPTVAGGGVPARAGHVVEDALGELDVGDVGSGGEWEGTFGCGHGGEAPKDLVIIALWMLVISIILTSSLCYVTWKIDVRTSWPASSGIMKSSVGLACARIACATTSL